MSLGSLDLQMPRTRFAILLIGLYLAAVGASAVAHLRRAYLEQRAARCVRELGGVVHYAWLLDSRVSPLQQFMRFPRFQGFIVPGDSWIERVFLMDCSHELLDEVIRDLGATTRLRQLDLSKSHIHDKSLRHLSSYVQLQSLNLFQTPITDEGASRYLSRLKLLKWLDVRGTRITFNGYWNLQRSLPGTCIESDFDSAQGPSVSGDCNAR